MKTLGETGGLGTVATRADIIEKLCHAELNAILNRSSGSLEGAKLYVTLFPCNECAKAIIQSGIKEVVYMSDKYADEANTIASKKMFDMVGIKYRIYEKTGRKLTIEL